MHILRHHVAAVGAGLAAALVLATVQPVDGADAAATQLSTARTARVTTQPIIAGAGWLATQFVDGTHLPHPDGNRFGEQFGGTWYPDYGLNADAIFGLAAAHAGAAKTHTALRYLAGHVHAYTGIARRHPAHRAYDGSVGKLALAAIVAGAHPRHFAGHNLLRVLRRDECVRASKSGEPCPAPGSAANISSSVSESFVLLAESRGGTGPSAPARAYFESLQCANGGFTSGTTACRSGRADVDATAYALMALQAMGGEQPAIGRAVHWLRGNQQPGGYWVSQRHPNVDSTGLAAAALAGLRRPVRSARAWLRSQQVPPGRRGAGAFRYAGKLQPTTTSATSPSVIATAQALTGLGAQGTLALVRSSGARRLAPMYRPRAAGRTVVRRGRHSLVRGFGFAAGERIRVRLLDGAVLGHGSAGPLGFVRIHYLVPRSLHAGRHTVVLHGVASRLAARHRIVVPRAARGGSAVATATFTALRSPAPTHVAIVISGKGARCIPWHKGITGDWLLNRVARVVYRQTDGLIVQIDGTPASATADSTHYWSYWHDVDGTWQYSSAGASGYQPAAGTVEGWAYDNGGQQPPKPNATPAGLYSAICGSADESAVPTPTPPVPTPTHSSAAPRHHPAAPARSHASAPNAVAAATTARHKPVAAAPARPPRNTRRPSATRRPQSRSRRPPATHTRSRRPAAHAHATTSHHPAAKAGTDSPMPSAASTSRPRLLVKPAAQSSRGSALPTLLSVGLVVLLLAGGGVLALRRRRAG